MNESLSGSTILVTGATGFLGSVLVPALARAGAHVRALAHRLDRDRYIRDVPGVEIVMGDITDQARMDEVTQGCDFVFHLAAALSGSLELQNRINVDGTRSVAAASARADVQRLIYVSSVAVYGYKHRADVHEDSPFTASSDPYVLSNRGAEQVICESISGYGLRSYTIIRPGMIYGARSVMWTRNAFRLARLRPTPWLGNGNGLCYPIYVDDLVDQMMLQARHPNAHNQAFNSTPDPAPTWRTYLTAYQQLLGRETWLPIPYWPVYGLLMLLSLPVTWIRGQEPAVLDYVRMSQSRLTYKMDKARDLLGWQPQVSLEEGVQRCVPYLRSKGWLD